MAYTPTNWQNGDTITAAGLNNMESGIENANEPFVVNITPTEPDFSGTMDKTGDDIYQAYLSGRRIRFVVQGFSAGADATMFTLLDDGAGGIDGVIASAFVAYDAGSGWMNILVFSGAYDSNTYTTTIFQLTPAT